MFFGFGAAGDAMYPIAPFGLELPTTFKDITSY